MGPFFLCPEGHVAIPPLLSDFHRLESLKLCAIAFSRKKFLTSKTP